jgi:hypothetical protein
MKKRMNLQTLIVKNKNQILSDQKEMEKIEKKIDERHQRKLQLQK